jgi:cytochrome c oxidase assembly protein subunit 11
MPEPSHTKNAESRSLVLRLLLMTVAMFGFGFLMVPIYDVFCEVTGLGGKTNTTAAVVAQPAKTGHEIRLEFDTTVNQYAPWEFESELDGMTVKAGGMYEAMFVARNLSEREKIAQAVPSVSPQQAAKYFKKLDCFCFTTQEFAGLEEKQMPVRFVIDSDIPEYIDTITLSYTFFDTARMSEADKSIDHGAHSAHN